MHVIFASIVSNENHVSHVNKFRVHYNESIARLLTELEIAVTTFHLILIFLTVSNKVTHFIHGNLSAIMTGKLKKTNKTD